MKTAKEIYHYHYLSTLGDHESSVQDKAILPAMEDFAKQKAIEFLDWVKNYEGEQKIILCDNDFYWEADDEGDNPMGGKELMEIFQNIKQKGK